MKLLAFCLATGLAAAHAAQPNIQALLPGKWPAYARFGGDAVDVKVAGNFAYVALYEAGLAIFDVSNPTNGVLAGTCETIGTAQGLDVSGNYVYLAGGDAGNADLQVIDISNPANCLRVGAVGINGRANTVTVVGNYAYLAADAVGLEVVDVSNPANPIRVGGYDPRAQTLRGRVRQLRLLGRRLWRWRVAHN